MVKKLLTCCLFFIATTRSSVKCASKCTSALQCSTVYKCSTVQCFNFGVYYVACSYCVENMDNFTLKCAIKKRIKVLRTR